MVAVGEMGRLYRDGKMNFYLKKPREAEAGLSDVPDDADFSVTYEDDIL